MFKNGDTVIQVLSAAISGTVCGYALDQSTGGVSVCVAYNDATGASHTRYFAQSELQAYTPVTTAATDASGANVSITGNVTA